MASKILYSEPIPGSKIDGSTEIYRSPHAKEKLIHKPDEHINTI